MATRFTGTTLFHKAASAWPPRVPCSKDRESIELELESPCPPTSPDGRARLHRVLPPFPHCSSLPRQNPTYLVEHLSVGRRVPSWIGSSVWGRSGGVASGSVPPLLLSIQQRELGAPAVQSTHPWRSRACFAAHGSERASSGLRGEKRAESGGVG